MSNPNVAAYSDEDQPTEIAMKEGQLDADEFNRRYPTGNQAPLIDAVPEPVVAEPVLARPVFDEPKPMQQQQNPQMFYQMPPQQNPNMVQPPPPNYYQMPPNVIPMDCPLTPRDS